MLLLVIVFSSTRTAVIAAEVVTVRRSLDALLVESDGWVELAIDITLADPNLDTDDTHFGHSLSLAEVDVGTESVEWRAAFLEHLLASHLSAIKTTRDLDFDTLSLAAHGLSDSHLDGTAISDTAFELTGDAVGDDCCIEIGALNLADFDLDLLQSELAQLLLKFVDLLTALANDDTRFCRENADGEHLESALDDDTRNARLAETFVEVLTNLLVLYDFVTEIVTAIPHGVPTAVDTKSVANWIDFLSHLADLFILVIGWFAVDKNRDVVGALADAVCAALRSRAETLEDASAVDEDSLDIEISGLDIGAFVLLLPVVDSREEELLEFRSSSLCRELEDTEGVVNLLATDKVSDESHLARRGWDVLQRGEVLRLALLFDFVSHYLFSIAHFALAKKFKRRELLTVAAVATESASESELSELVTHHVLSDVDRDELVAIVDSHGMADEVR